MARKTFITSGSFRPFDCLRELAASRENDPSTASETIRKGRFSSGRREMPPAAFPDGLSEDELFHWAMADVTPVHRGNCVACESRRTDAPVCDPDDPSETLDRLQRLVDRGEGFVVAHTPEYMEGADRGVPPDLARRLHRGKYAIQAHIDLHGCRVAEARRVFDDFLRDAIATGNRGLLVVHGRGLSSPAGPVLKSKVRQWLTSGPWRRWVLAFASARPVDGGAGATYVLLRRRPRPKAKRRQAASGEALGG
jgi:DNA-nicking Smr family endonuclease